MIFNNFMGILLGPTDLDGFKTLIRSLTSIKVTGVRRRELDVLLGKYSKTPQTRTRFSIRQTD